MHPTRYWQRIDAERIQCDLCPRVCKLREGQFGACFVRAHQDNAIVLTAYGRASSFCVDPIEKKPLYHFLPGTPVLSFGTAGCNLACKFCQNWQISKAFTTAVLAQKATPERIVQTAQRFGCKSIAFTYNDPVIFLEYAIDVAQSARTLKLNSIAVTAGYINAEARRDFFAHMDATNIDLKAFSESFYRRYCAGRLHPVLDTLLYVRHETSAWLELTTLLIPGANDSSKEIEQLSQWVALNLGPDVPLHFTAFHPDWRLQDVPPTSAASLRRARDIAIANGLHYVYLGNCNDEIGAATYCRGCGRRLIARDAHAITDWQLRGNQCQACGMHCHGKFEGLPGSWGGRRLPVQVQ